MTTTFKTGRCSYCGALLTRGDGYGNYTTEFTDDWHAAHALGCSGGCGDCPVQCGPVVEVADPVEKGR